MSQPKTAPESNPTMIVSNPTQMLQVIPQVQVTNFQFDSVQDILEQKSFSIEQLDWVKIAKKNKTIGNFLWVTSSTIAPYNLNVNMNFVRSLIPIGKSFNNFGKYTKLLITIKPTSNSLYQGLLGFFFDPSPTSTYLQDYFGMDLSDIRIAHQFQKVWISPENTNEINMLIPINYPFEFFKLLSAGTTTSHGRALYDYTNNYSFGTLKTIVYSPLATTSTNNTLRFNVSAQILDLQTAGLYINNGNL